MITEEIKEKNFSIFIEKLNNLGFNLDLTDDMVNKLKNATYSMNNEYGLGFDGSLLNTVLRVLTPYAVKLNNLLSEDLKVNQDKIVKVCLLQHLAKMNMFIKNDNQWEIEKLGKLYKYNPKKIALRLGARSVALANSLGITFDEEELEAMLIIDKDVNDDQKTFATPLSIIVKQANEWVTTESMFKKN